MKTCTVTGCTAKHHAKGLCFTHYVRVRRTGIAGDATPQRHPNYKATETLCCEPSCHQPATRKQRCPMHYMRLYRSINLPTGVPCMAQGCTKLSTRRGFCPDHQYAVAKTAQWTRAATKLLATLPPGAQLLIELPPGTEAPSGKPPSGVTLGVRITTGE